MENPEKQMFIDQHINSIKTSYPFLRDKSDDFVFTALCLRAIFFRNPNQPLEENDLKQMLVDGRSDGGVDALLLDPNSDSSDMVLCQSKKYQSITRDDISDAVHKLADFYSSMQHEQSEKFSRQVRERFSLLEGDTGEESKICFYFFTSAPKNGIRSDTFNKIINQQFHDDSKYELHIYFLDDLIEEIKEAESMRGSVESGTLDIESDNCLYYGDDAVIVNVEAYSIKKLYSAQNIKLLAQNLRYYVRKKDIDDQIKDTIRNDRENFWYKNNGLTIICDDFEISGPILKLTNFSIINGGQTTTLIGKNPDIDKEHSFYLTCKVIRNTQETREEKSQFVLSIAQATNSQKAIKQADLKANTPEQVRFGNRLRSLKVYYQTKRGEEIPKQFKDKANNTNLIEVGKLALAGIFQLPASSRNKPSSMFKSNFYNPVFFEESDNVSRCIKDLLYVDNYFRKTFVTTFDKEFENDPTQTRLVTFANNSRTICIAYVALVSRYLKGFITKDDIKMILDKSHNEDAYENYFYDLFRKKDTISNLFADSLDNMNKDDVDKTLFELLKQFIRCAQNTYMNATNGGTTINETNYLKKDQNYYNILCNNWSLLQPQIEGAKAIFSK